MTSAQPTDVSQVLAAITAACMAKQVAVGDGARPVLDDAGQSFIVAWVDAGVVSAHTLAGPRARRTLTCVFHGCGLSPDSARYAIATLREVLLALPAVVGDRRLQLPEQLTARPLTRDDDIKPPLFTQTDEWRIRTSPST